MPILKSLGKRTAMQYATMYIAPKRKVPVIKKSQLQLLLVILTKTEKREIHSIIKSVRFTLTQNVTATEQKV